MNLRFLTLSALLFSTLALAQQPADEPNETALLDPATAVTTRAPADPFARDTYRITPVVCPFKGEI
ncbi:MAG: hypothetical protein P8Y54_14870, partial [Xanthomonadales bacterium]